MNPERILVKQTCPTPDCKMVVETLLRAGDSIPSARLCVCCDPSNKRVVG